MIKRIDKLVELIKEQNNLNQQDKIKWKKIQSKINKIESLELEEMEINGCI